MTRGTVVQAADVHAERTTSGAIVRTLFALDAGGHGLARRLAGVGPWSRLEGTAGAGGELWFVITGAGTLTVEGHTAVPLWPDRGLWIPASTRYQVDTDAEELRLDLVTLPVVVTGSANDVALDPGLTAPLARDLAECEVEVTGDRQFRVLFGPGHDCPVATQFVGQIPPGRAPDHSHPYDEVVLVLEGEGLVHIDGASHPLSAGTSTHLPPGLPHCLENTGSGTMRVLGVFHPADSPAAKLS